MPNQYATVKNVAKGEDVIKDNQESDLCFCWWISWRSNENFKSIYEADEDVDYEYWSSNHHAHATLSISNYLFPT
jgi:hypothetical protein